MLASEAVALGPTLAIITEFIADRLVGAAADVDEASPAGDSVVTH